MELFKKDMKCFIDQFYEQIDLVVAYQKRFVEENSTRIVSHGGSKPNRNYFQ